MSIYRIERIDQHDDGSIHVEAIIEDVVLTHPQTYFEPAEYGPGLCVACFTLEDEEIFPTTEYEQMEFLESLDLDWELVDNTDYDLFDDYL
jgi:hypothetical protein